MRTACRQLPKIGRRDVGDGVPLVVVRGHPQGAHRGESAGGRYLLTWRPDRSLMKITPAFRQATMPAARRRALTGSWCAIRGEALYQVRSKLRPRRCRCSAIAPWWPRNLALRWTAANRVRFNSGRDDGSSGSTTLAMVTRGPGPGCGFAADFWRTQLLLDHLRPTRLPDAVPGAGLERPMTVGACRGGAQS